MKASVKKRWLKALRSGEYEQASGQLRVDPSAALGQVAPHYCCLGVLCEVVGAEYRPSDGLPGGKTLAAAGLPEEKADKLAGHNDNGHSFNWIAAYIERYL